MNFSFHNVVVKAQANSTRNYNFNQLSSLVTSVQLQYTRMFNSEKRHLFSTTVTRVKIAAKCENGRACKSRFSYNSRHHLDVSER